MADVMNAAINAAKGKFVDYALPLIIGGVIIAVVSVLLAKK
ncbi:hypothetical protein [Methanofollis ethanolicus]|nr:hypothetical protein [Methanofollis ethanolicus]